MIQKDFVQSSISLLKKIWHWNYSPVILLACITFSAHFLFFQHFGIYEDDLWLVLFQLSNINSLSELPQRIIYHLGFFHQGRPIGFMLTTFLVAIFGKLGGLPGIYLAGFLIVWINASLMYLLIFKWTKIKLLAFLAAVVFTLYPADTTHALLSHNLNLQYALTWLLLAFHFDLANKKWLAYSFAGLILLTYETPFLMFLSAPLFQPNIPKKDLRKNMSRHFLIMMSILIIYVSIRLIMGEGRLLNMASGAVDNISSLSLPFRILIAMFIGPITSLSTFLLGPIDTLRSLTPAVLASILLSFGGFFLLINNIKSHIQKRNEKNTILQISQPFFFIKMTLNPEVLICARLFLASLPAMMLAYVFSFTHFPPWVTTGRTSSVHLASAFPGAILVSTLFYLGISLFEQWQKKRLGFFSIAVILSLIFGYRVLIQEDFKLGWMKTSRMMAQVIEQSQDINPTTTVIIDTTGLNDSRFIKSFPFDYLFYGIFNIMYDYGPEFDPKFIIIPHIDQRYLQKADNGQYYYSYGGDPPFALENGNTIYITWNGKRFIRQYGEMQFQDTTLKLKPLGETTLNDSGETFAFNWFYKPELLNLEGPIELNTLFH